MTARRRRWAGLGALWAFQQPDPSAPASEVVDFYGDLSTRIVVGGSIGLGAESINMAAALRAGDDQLSEELALALFDVSYVFGTYAAGIGFGVFTLAVSASALRNGLPLPRWLAFAGIVIGLAMVTPLAGFVIGQYTVAPAFVLLLVLAVRLLRSER